MVEESIDELIQHLEALRVREDTLVQQIIQARARENQQQEKNTGTRVDRAAADYWIGDCIRIVNQSRGLIGKAVTECDRVGTVTKIMRKRVFLQTDNGMNTNCAPENCDSYHDWWEWPRCHRNQQY
jgi:cell division septum initiation protein DivIVA